MSGAIGTQRAEPAGRVLDLALCAADRNVERWSSDDWRWLISGAGGAHG